MFGGRIRRARKEKKLTLDGVAGQVGISKGYLSQIENDRIEPSLSVLRKLSACLELPMVQLMQEEAAKKPVPVKKGSTTINKQELDICYDVISPPRSQRGGARFFQAHCRLKPGCRLDNRVLDKDCEQLIFILGGVLTYYVGDTAYTLAREHSIYVPNNTGHYMVNNTQQEVELVWVLRPVHP